MRAKAVAQSSDPARADEALAAVQQVRHRAAGLFELDVGLAEAWTHNAAGRRTAARRRARDTAQQAQDAGALVVAAEAWHDLARLGEPGDAVAPMRRARRGDRGTAGDGVGRARRRPRRPATRPALDQAADQLEAVGLLLHAAEAAAEAAVVHERAGRRGSALTSMANARRLRAECPGAAAAPSTRGRVPLHELTDREREIAELAARGHSNREIADAAVPVDPDGEQPPQPRLHQARVQRSRAARHRPRPAAVGRAADDLGTPLPMTAAGAAVPSAR